MASLHKQLTDEQISEFKEIFNLVDGDGSGEISKDELGKLMSTLGLRPTDDQLDMMMSEVDTDGSGAIDFDEFIAVMSRKVDTEYTEKELLSAFRVFESDLPEGWVRTEHILHALMTYGEENLTPKQAMELLSTMDPSKTGKINYIDSIKQMTRNLNMGTL